MATREDRMRQRLRGAVRHQIEDISFGFDLPEFGHDEITEEVNHNGLPPSLAPTPIKPRKASSPRSQASSGLESRVPSTENIFTQGLDVQDTDVAAADEGPGITASSHTSDDILALLPPISSSRAYHTRRSQAISDVIEESPRHAPGSGHRISLPLIEVGGSSRRLQTLVDAMSANEQDGIVSSPLARKSTGRASGEALDLLPGNLSPHVNSTHTQTGDIDELSPLAEKPSLQKSHVTEDIRDQEAARVLLRKRPWRSSKSEHQDRRGRTIASSSNEEHTRTSRSSLETSNVASIIPTNPAAKRRKRSHHNSAKPKRLILKSPSLKQSNQISTPTTQNGETSADEIGSKSHPAVVPLTVQRFPRTRKSLHGADHDHDILSSEIPFGNQKGVNVIDVLNQSCEEVISICIKQLFEAAQREDAPFARKELRARLRALEDFVQELRTKFLTQTILLDNLHSLRQRVRDAEGTRNKLRDNIYQRRRDREDIQLRIDSERLMHETNQKILSKRMDMSSDFHLICSSAEQGKREVRQNTGLQYLQKPNLSLGLEIHRIGDRVCRVGDRDGLMHRVAGFNRFLERAAIELEGRT